MDALIIIIFAILIVTVIMIWIYSAYKDGYAAGQIAAMNGKQEYRLIEFEDGIRKYYKESELKDLITHKIIK
jgi:hypothetical protein